MNLWFSGLFLVVGLILSSSAQTPEECQPMITPKETFTPMYGKWTFIMGFSDNAVFDAKYKSTTSQWVHFKKSPTGNANEMVEAVAIKHGSYCKTYSTTVTIVGNSGISQKFNFTCTFHSLPTCPDCLLYHVTSINTRNLLKHENPTVKEELTGYRAYYLMSKRSTITDEEVAYAKKQARCLGFGAEPTFHYDPDHSLCDEEEEEDD